MIGMTTLFAMLAAAIGPVVGKTGTAERKAKRRPVGFQLRNPVDPVQAARIEAAEAKRQRKAEKLYRDARYSGGQNYYAYAANILNVNK